MLTRNFLVALGNNNNGLLLDNCPAAIATAGDSYELRLGTGNDSCFLQQWNNAKLVIGTGTTKPKITDIKIENEINSDSYNCSSPLWKKYIKEEEKDCLNMGGIITNTDASNIEFSEVGLYVYITWNGGRYVMLAREVYDTPITIAPGESVAVNVNIM